MRGESHVKREAETKVVYTIVKEQQRLLATMRSGKNEIGDRFSLRASIKEPIKPSMHLDFKI
jgi:hypothetical protein